MRVAGVLFGLAGIAAAATVNVCVNNCGRAVAGTARASPALSVRQSLCSEFVTTTETFTPSTVTVTTGTIFGRNVHDARAPSAAATPEPVVTAEKPAYASACPDATAYWSACQCFVGVVATTVTVTAPTPTETVPAATCTQGAEFAIYALDAGSDRFLNLEQHMYAPWRVNYTLQFSGVEPNITGLTPSIGGVRQEHNWEVPISIYGTTGPAGSAMARTIIDHRGYFVPQIAGFYMVWLESADNALYAWVGDRALSGWTASNANLYRMWPPEPGSRDNWIFDVRDWALGVPIPFRFLWWNAGGPGAFSVRVTDPRGSHIFSPETPPSSRVISSCSGPGAPVGPWAPWAEEI